MGKELRFSSIYYPPASVILYENDTTIYDGYEYHLVREWAKQNNFTWKVYHNQDGWWGEVYQNGSGWGMTGYLSMDWVDISCSDLIPWFNEVQFTDFRLVP